MEYFLPYGTSQLTFHLPMSLNADWLPPNPTYPPSNPEQIIQDALDAPLGKNKLPRFSEAGSVGIVINDKTRPVPMDNPLPLLLNHLQFHGIQKDRITLFVGTGTHQMTPEELPRILSQEVIDQYSVIIHHCDSSAMVDLGNTSLNTPVLVNADFYNKDLKLTVGNIEPHHFMGFSGGVKTASIGLASRQTITRNHAMLTHRQAVSGTHFTNPMRQDIEEIGRKMGIHFTLGTILDEDKRILKAYFGEPSLVMRTAIPAVREIFGVRVAKHYDLVIASPGGAPKDINLYQAQKGLTHACRITRDGGWVILLAACPEGSGSKLYEDFVTSAKSNQAIMQKFKEGFFKVGPHKAYQIAKDAQRVNIILVSDIHPEVVKQWKLTPSKPDLLEPLLRWVQGKLPPNPRIAIMPSATHTMPEVNQ